MQREPCEYFPPVETHVLRSERIVQNFRIDVMIPAMTRGEQVRLPVVYATDGNLTFDMFKGISRLLQISGREVARFILVGIGYPGDCPHAGAVLRGRDFIFSGYPEIKRPPPAVEGVAMAEEGAKASFGAEDFQDFMQSELFPFIDRQYPTIPGARTYFGHSAGGGFGLFTLCTRSSLFVNYLISSPGLSYHGEAPGGAHYDRYDFLFEYMRRFIAAEPSLDNVRLYLSVGGEEEFEPGLEQWQLTSSFVRMVNLLKTARIRGLQMTSEILPGETHASSWPIAFMHGIRAVLAVNKQ